jgi:hypothetical protein
MDDRGGAVERQACLLTWSPALAECDLEVLAWESPLPPVLPPVFPCKTSVQIQKVCDAQTARTFSTRHDDDGDGSRS